MNGTISKSCCFTGHRKISPADEEKIKKEVIKQIRLLYTAGYKRFYAGGALGFDMLAEKCVLELKETYKDMELVVVSPCKNQAARWKADAEAEYEEIKARCDEFVCLSEEYTPYCFFVRNRYLVEHSSVCIAFYIPGEKSSGTEQTVNYAKSKGLKIINIANF